jgi:tetratricopeptide (TPR) repeat protein
VNNRHFVRRQKWKDELTPVVIAAVSQFVALRVVDWANANKETNENAANLVAKHFYYAPQILVVVIIFFTVRSVRVYLDEQGIRLGSFLRQSVLAILFAAALIFVAHRPARALVGTFTGEKSVAAFAKALEASAFYELLSRNAVLRLLIDLVALVVTLVSLRYSKLPTGEGSGRSLEKAGEFLKAGEAYLKENNLKKAKAAFRKAKAPTRLAALELRDGNHREAARLFEEAGDTFAWEAALAWGEAGDREKAEAARVRALADARNMSRWDRLAEIADASGDVHVIAEASRRLAEGKPPGAGRTGLFRRAGDCSSRSINLRRGRVLPGSRVLPRPRCSSCRLPR